MSSPNFVPMGFTLWFSINREQLEQEFEVESPHEKVECSDCLGTGYVECNMCYEHDCEECDGHGKIQETLRDYAMSQYDKNIAQDVERVKNYEAFIGVQLCH